MKKLLGISSSKILIFCTLGLVITLGSFWHYQVNQVQLDRMNVLGQGIGTCFNRISQTFTAMMIKDIKSPYLNRGFMALSDECLNETIKGANPFQQSSGKGYETLNKLISEVHWFHEKVLKIHSPMLAGQDLNPPMNGLSDKFGKIEAFKVDVLDEVDQTNSQMRVIQANDEVLMGAGLLIFVIALSLLALQEFNRLQLQREIEKQALNLLKTGQANVGAIVDQLVERGLTSQGMPVSAQVFRDYHGELLERMAVRNYNFKEPEQAPVPEKLEESAPLTKTSLKEVLVSLQNINPQNLIQFSDVRDVQLAVDYEEFEQLMNAAVNKLSSRRDHNKKIMISNQIHSDRSVINLFMSGTTFSASELEFFHNNQNVAVDGLDMNLIIMKEMVTQTHVECYLENKTDRQGAITGMGIRFTVKRVSKDRSKNLISVVKGRKKDLAREMTN